jgi:hypothetical protein
MNYFILFFCFATIFLSGCDMREREENLQQKEASLNEKEQQLLLKEKSLQLKEEELAKKQQLLDSTMISDTTAKYNANLIGTWAVQMTCTETTCSGSAVGDTKTETWEINYQNNNVMAKAKVNEELVRVYSGIFTGNTLELVETLDSKTQPTTRIVVRLRVVNEAKLEGQREIERLNEKCKIIYAMTMDKK